MAKDEQKHTVAGTQQEFAPLLTPRLCLKPLTKEDGEAVFRYRSLPEISKYQGWDPISGEDAARFIEEETSPVMNNPGTWLQLGIFLRETDTLIGDLGIHFLQLGSGTEVEVGITISPDRQRKGYGLEALSNLLDDLFGRWGKTCVTASVDPENTKSMNLMQRMGFHLVEVKKNGVLFRGEWVDDAVFSLSLEQWQNR